MVILFVQTNATDRRSSSHCSMDEDHTASLVFSDAGLPRSAHLCSLIISSFISVAKIFGYF